MLVAGDLDYRATARFTVNGPVQQARAVLLDLLWQLEKQDDSPNLRYAVTAPASAARLDLWLHQRDPETADRMVRRLVDDFRTRINLLTQKAEASEADVQALVDQLLTEFASDAASARTAADRAGVLVPEESPSGSLASLRNRIADRVEALQALRASEQAIRNRLDRLNTSPAPSAGTIDPQERQAAYAARTDLQQDLQQLQVQLTLGRRNLRGVWQAASPHLDNVIAAAGRLARSCFAGAAGGTSPAQQRHHQTLGERTTHYQKRLATFAEKWTKAFTGLRSRPIDPTDPRLMSTQHRLHDLLGEFSFHGGKLMGDMRKEVRALGQQSDARHHTLVSEVKRRFHRLESAHRQLEFVASDVFCRNNFRLDSAMKSASGLFRRAQRATSEVDARLEAEALVQVGAERIAARAQAHAKREELREDIDAVADQLVAMIGEYTATVPLTEQYLRPSLSFDAARQRLTDAEQTLRKCQGFMTALAGLREASAEPISIELMDCSVARAPGGMTKRALWAVLATLLTVTGLGYVGRRWRPFPG